MEPGRRTAPRRGHPAAPELAGGLSLSVEELRGRPDAAKMESFLQMLENAKYWLSFDLHAFEPSLTTAPSPLRELGVAIALKFSEGVDARLQREELDGARTYVLRRVAPDLRPGIAAAIDRLGAILDARDRQAEWQSDGYVAYAPEPALSVHALRAMGRGTIVVDGDAEAPETLELDIATPTRLAAVDEKGRPLPPPEIETDTAAPLLVRDRAGERETIFLVPGSYRLRIRGRAEGDKKAVVR